MPQYFLWIYGKQELGEQIRNAQDAESRKISAIKQDLDALIIKPRGTKKYYYKWVDGAYKYLGKVGGNDYREQKMKLIDKITDKRDKIRVEMYRIVVSDPCVLTGEHLIISKKIKSRHGCIPLDVFCPYIAGGRLDIADKEKTEGLSVKCSSTSRLAGQEHTLVL